MRFGLKVAVVVSVASMSVLPFTTAIALAPGAGANTLAAGVPAYSQSVVTLTASRDRAMVTTDVELAIQVRPGVSNRVANLQASLNGSGGVGGSGILIVSYVYP
jgi:hypothetical protein